jgi:hypothetical protein
MGDSLSWVVRCCGRDDCAMKALCWLSLGESDEAQRSMPAMLASL